MATLADKLREKTTVPEYREGLDRVRGPGYLNDEEKQDFPEEVPGYETVLVYMNFEGRDDPRKYIDQVIEYLQNTGGIDPITEDHEATYFGMDSVGGYFAMQIRQEDIGKFDYLMLQRASINRGIDPNAPGVDI